MKTYRKKTAIILVILSLIMVSPIIQQLITGFKNPFFKNLGFTINTLAPWYAWIISIMITTGYIVYTFRAIPFVSKMQRELSIFKLIGLFSGFIAGIIEELFFRRWLMDYSLHNGLGIISQIVISGLVFGFAHTIWSMFGGKRKIGLGAALSTTGLGLALAIVYVIGNRNIGPCIVAHCLISMIIEPWLMLAAVSGQWKTVKIDN